VVSTWLVFVSISVNLAGHGGFSQNQYALAIVDRGSCYTILGTSRIGGRFTMNAYLSSGACLHIAKPQQNTGICKLRQI